MKNGSEKMLKTCSENSRLVNRQMTIQELFHEMQRHQLNY